MHEGNVAASKLNSVALLVDVFSELTLIRAFLQIHGHERSSPAKQIQPDYVSTLALYLSEPYDNMA